MIENLNCPNPGEVKFSGPDKIEKKMRLNVKTRRKMVICCK